MIANLTMFYVYKTFRSLRWREKPLFSDNYVKWYNYCCFASLCVIVKTFVDVKLLKLIFLNCHLRMTLYICEFKSYMKCLISVHYTWLKSYLIPKPHECLIHLLHNIYNILMQHVDEIKSKPINVKHPIF